jgi:NADPH-dependent 2,4-dienoyl-CoA reductase/sulfur reductase-like enzyme
MITADVLIAGAGPAGLSAAIEAADAGADVVVVDENDRAGGQIYRQPPPAIRARTDLGSYATGRDLLQAVESRPRIRMLCRTTVWAAPGNTTLSTFTHDRVGEVSGRCVIVCTGAHDRPVPFPGWTIPGVITAGAALTLLKGQQILPGRNVLLAGAGPLQLVLATYLLDGGAHVASLLEASTRWALYRRVPRLLSEWALVREGMQYVGQLRSAGLRVRYGHTILGVEGDERVRKAIITRVDEKWRPVHGTEETLEVDAVICGFGFVPSIDLTTLLGCDHHYSRMTGGWVPTHNADMRTSLPDVLVAGETTGVAGGIVAREEGKIAGITAARQLGYLTEPDAARRSAAPRKRLARLYRFRRALDEIHTPREGLLDLTTPDTLVCRCEEVTARCVLDALQQGARLTNDVKLRTRAGMGPCQGRMCATSIAALIGRHCSLSPEEAGRPSLRPPAKPVPLSAFAHGAEH